MNADPNIPPLISDFQPRAKSNKSTAWFFAGLAIFLGLLALISLVGLTRHQTPFDLGYQQAGIDAGLKEGQAHVTVYQHARRLSIKTNDFEVFRASYEQGYRMSVNAINKFTRDAMEARERAEHPFER